MDIRRRGWEVPSLQLLLRKLFLSTPRLFEAGQYKLPPLSSISSVLKGVFLMVSWFCEECQNFDQTFAFDKAGEIVGSLHLGERFSEQLNVEL